METMKKIAEALESTVQELFFEEEEKIDNKSLSVNS